MNDRVFVRYWLLQLPGWVLLLALLWMMRSWLDFAAWIPFAVLGIWFVKDLLLYPLLKSAYDTSDRPSATGRLVGVAGTAEQDLSPVGYVRVRGELWRAEMDRAADDISRGDLVRVTDVDGMTLRVAREEARAATPDRPRW